MGSQPMGARLISLLGARLVKARLIGERLLGLIIEQACWGESLLGTKLDGGKTHWAC